MTRTTKQNLLQYILIHFSKPSHIKWIKINKDREDLSNVINEVDLIKSY